MNGRIHVLRAPETTTERESEQLASLTRLERRYLSGRMCAWCEKELHRVGCGAFLGEPCYEDTRIERRRKCLAEYRPRKRRTTR